MTRPIGTFHNVETGEVVVREFNDEEYAQWEQTQAIEKAEAEALAKAASDKAALLAKLGITEDEAKLLLG